MESSEPTPEEILEKYNQEKKSLFFHLLIDWITDLIAALIFLSPVFFGRSPRSGYGGDKFAYSYSRGGY